MLLFLLQHIQEIETAQSAVSMLYVQTWIGQLKSALQWCHQAFTCCSLCCPASAPGLMAPCVPGQVSAGSGAQCVSPLLA